MSRIGWALGVMCMWAGWSHTVSAQQPYFNSPFGASYSSHQHHCYHQAPQPSYGGNFGGYGSPAGYQPPPSWSGYGPGYGAGAGYGFGGYPNGNYYPPAPQPNYGHQHHHHQHQPVYQPPYQAPYQTPYQSHPWHLGHFLLGT